MSIATKSGHLDSKSLTRPCVIWRCCRHDDTYSLKRISQNQIISGTWTPSFYEYDGRGNVRQLYSDRIPVDPQTVRTTSFSGLNRMDNLLKHHRWPRSHFGCAALGDSHLDFETWV